MQTSDILSNREFVEIILQQSSNPKVYFNLLHFFVILFLGMLSSLLNLKKHGEQCFVKCLF